MPTIHENSTGKRDYLREKKLDSGVGAICVCLWQFYQDSYNRLERERGVSRADWGPFLLSLSLLESSSFL